MLGQSLSLMLTGVLRATTHLPLMQLKEKKKKKKGNDQELIQSNPKFRPQNQKRKKHTHTKRETSTLTRTANLYSRN